MILTAANRPKRLLVLVYGGHVRPGDLDKHVADIRIHLAAMPRGFRMLADFTRLDSMDVGCTREIGRLMELLDHAGVSQVVRIMPDANKDIGMNILTLFHYSQRPQVVTCMTLAEAGEALGL